LPKLPGENTATQQIVDRLLLIAKRAAVRMRKAAVRELVRSPAAVMRDQPEKEFAVPGGPKTSKSACSVQRCMARRYPWIASLNRVLTV